jgi:hypothetical protein
MQGVRYRRKINEHSTLPKHNTPAQDNKSSLPHSITSAPISQLTDAESMDFIHELTEKSRKRSYVKWIGIPLTLCYLIFLTSHYQQETRTVESKNYFLKINSETINLRQKPNAQSRTLETLTGEVKLNVLDSSNPGWYKVSALDTIGYVSKKLVSMDSTVVDSHTYTLQDDHPDSFAGLFWAGLLAGISLCIYLRKLDKKRLTIEIYYEMDEKIKQVHQRFLQHFAEIMLSGRVWQYLHTQNTIDQKHHAGASKLITRIPIKTIRTDKKPERFFRTNVAIPNIQLRNSDLYFFPERLVIKRGKTFGAVFYKHLSISGTDSRFIEDGVVPRDAEIVDRTWRYLNKNGTPDKRFKDNPELPVCLYSQYHLSSPTGINELLTTSKKGAFDNFVKFLTAIGELQDRMALQSV